MRLRDFREFLRFRDQSIKSIELHKTKLVIDGHQMQRQLCSYSGRTQKDQKFCTDYTTYAETIRRFLRRLRICEVIPVIVFDGSIEPKRYEEGFDQRIQDIRKILKNDYSCGYQSPTLCNYVFGSVVREFGVEVIQSRSQTCRQMAELANTLECPLVCHKRSFFAMNTNFGIITTDLFCDSNLLHYNTCGKYWFLSCRLFCTDYLFQHYIGLKPEVMPLLSVVLDNNFIDQKGYQALSHDLKGWHEKCKIDILFNWLRDKSLSYALESIIKYFDRNSFKYNKTQTVAQTVRQLMERHGLSLNYETESLETLAKGDAEVSLPNWFVDEYQKGIVRPALMNIVEWKTHVLYPQMEDFSRTSSYECTLSLRRFLYGILRSEAQSPTKIKVLDRNGLNKSEELVAPLLHLSNEQKLPFLGTIRKFNIKKRRAMFLSVLEVSESFVNKSKVSLMLFECSEEIDSIDSTTFLFIIIRYLIKNNQSEDWKPFVGAFILAVMYYSRRDLKTDHKWAQLCKAPVDDIFEPKYVHFFSQLQAGLHIANFINIILGFPLREGKPYYCLNGIFVYNATKRLSNVEEYEPFLNHLFRDWSALVSIYNELIQLVFSDLTLESII